MSHQQIAILDFGSQYTHLIARRFRQLGVLAKLYPTDYDLSQIDNLIGVVLSGSPGSVDDNQYPFNAKVLKAGLPILGLCYGHQLIAQNLGGGLKKQEAREYGKATMQVGQSVLFDGLEGGEVVWMSHGDSVDTLPKDFRTIGSTEGCPIAAMANEAEKIYGLQFHPEVTHTNAGLKILENFAYKICRAERDWQLEDWEKEIAGRIKKQVGDKKVFLLVSGGVDSTVCFALLNKALGEENVYGLHIDTGLMRKDEVVQVQGSLAQAGFKNLEVKDCSELFLSKLKGVVEPEEKRKIIGQLFIEIKDQVSDELKLNPNDWLLGQGTIYPDTIETGGTVHADTIKTHHNRVDQIQELISQGRVIEPLKDLYKDEVRELGKLLGLSEKLIWRQPFPGPGLGIRLLCHKQGEAADISQVVEKLYQAFDKIKIIEELCEDCEIYPLPIKSVGVQGDFRTYAHPAVIKRPGQSSEDFDWLKVEKISPAVTNKVKEVNRVLLNVGRMTSDVGKGELIDCAITKERLDLLREIDAIVQQEIFKADLEKDIWQFPVVLVPFGLDNKESVVLRPVSSLEAMTARFYPLEKEVLSQIVSKIESLNKTSFIFYDVTNKPPGTIEWE
jgi:GMP synthase (glutamine-hydrolysing)